MKKDLDKIMMDQDMYPGMTVNEWLLTQPEAWRAIETEAIYECMRKGWDLHVMNIQSTARELGGTRKLRDL